MTGEMLEGHVGSAYVQVLADWLAARGHGLDDFPGGAALRAAAGASHVVSVTAWRDLLTAVAAALSLPTLGLAVGGAFTIAHLGLLGYALQSCPTLGAALARLARYERLINDVNPLHWRIAGDVVELEWGWERGRPGPLVDEGAIATFTQMTRRMLGRDDLGLRAVDFINPPPPDVAPYDAFFGCAVRFGRDRTRLSFPVALLAEPLERHDPVLADLLAAQVDAQLAALPAEADIVQRVRRALAHRLSESVPSLETVAADLGLSPRSLHRRLEAAGHGFRALWEDTRLHLARTYLGDPRLTLTEIAHLLGYSDQSAFTRAFRRWTGEAPGTWRRRQA
ncbi:AraC family transcriptional regulator [Zavarzinia compransoris]|uniref:AraC family transcriptional regulator n=1 Tax=Zavarzinia marina TaxID=2911065 RepID=UPI001F1B69C7|nr:AraC family transcriptional regulator [Zavarzinia marina]MCF4164670.1 AraC family transcriptional regulator [Zavarzinia marina]